MNNGIEHFFMCLSTISVSSFIKNLFKSFAYLKNWIAFLLLICRNYIFIHSGYESFTDICIIFFFLVCALVVYFLNDIFWYICLFAYSWEDSQELCSIVYLYRRTQGHWGTRKVNRKTFTLLYFVLYQMVYTTYSEKKTIKIKEFRS